MITRGLQMQHYGELILNSSSNVTYNQLTQSWSSDATLPQITYASGVFTIPKASKNNFLITWTISMKTSFAYWGLGTNFYFYGRYPYGTFDEGNMSCNGRSTGLIVGTQLIHILSVSPSDILTFSIRYANYEATYLTTPSVPFTSPLTNIDAVNACITIISI